MPCAHLDCAGVATCRVVEDAARCVCDIGFYDERLGCVAGASGGACAGVFCSGHGACAVLASAALCVCEAGYHNIGTVECEADYLYCQGIDCSGVGTCVVTATLETACACNEGYHDDGLTRCVANSPTPCIDERDCDDGNECTGDVCEHSACRHQPVANGVSCDDGLFCTVGGLCNAGMCVTTPRDCDDAEACTLDACNEDTDRCDNSWQEHPELAETCWDGIDDDCDGVIDGCCRDVGDFAPMVEYAAGDYVHGVAAGDYNADGIVDLATASYNTDMIGVLLGNGSAGRGNGTFSAPAFYGASGGPAFILTADLDADGILDLISPNFRSPRIDVFLGHGSDGKGDGTFAGPVAYPVENSSRSIAAVDLNRDGTLDLAVVNQGSDSISILLGLGDGTFGPTQSFPAGDAPDIVVTGDFNADGIVDLAVNNEASGDITVLLGVGAGGRGTGTFAPAVGYAIGMSSRVMITRDFDADGILDLAVTVASTGDLEILLGNGANGRGDGTFADAVAYPVPDSIWCGFVTPGDFNNDGIVDLILANHGSYNISLFFGNGSNGRGDGTFAFHRNYPAVGGAALMTVADFNSDGVSDVALSGASSDTLAVFMGLGAGARANGAFAPAVEYGVATSIAAMVMDDFDADAILDLVVVDPNTNQLHVLLGGGSNGRGNGQLVPLVSYATGSGPRAIARGDFNADHIPDLAVANYAANSVSIFLGAGSEGKGSGTFSPGAILATAGGPTWLEVSDLDADGILDLTVARADDQQVSVFLGGGSDGRGDGSFAHHDDCATVGAPRFAVAGDFNADGIPDLAVLTAGPDQLSILLGTGGGGRGDGGYALGQSYVVRGVHMVAADLNHDHRLDLVVADEVAGTLTVLLGGGADGKGDGTFAPASIIPVKAGVAAVTVGDIDRDSIVDLVAVSSSEASAVVLLGGGSSGRGDGTFAVASEYALGPGPRLVVNADLDRDSILDLVVASSVTGNVSVLLGEGSCAAYP
jgi:hypothetical protein